MMPYSALEIKCASPESAARAAGARVGVPPYFVLLTRVNLGFD